MKKRKFRKRVLIFCFMFVLVNVILFFGQKKCLKYEVEAKIAKPIIILEKDKTLKTKINQLSFPMEYYFWIHNYEEEEINEIEFEYSIELENSVTNFPISYVLIDCDTNKEVDLKNGKSENLKIKKDVKESRKFKLVFRWQELNVQLAEELQIKLKINVLQNKEGTCEI